MRISSEPTRDQATSQLEGDISVVVPVFNRQDLIGRALLSVRAQTCQPIEIVVVDDGSMDDTAGVIARDFPDVNYQRQEHSGVSAARNRGVEQCRGGWLAFLDSDDEWTPDKLSRQMEELRKEPDYRICHTNELWIRNGRRVNQGKRHAKSGGWIYEECLPLCAISPSSSLIHRSVFEDIGGFDEELEACEDYDLWLRICSRHPVLLVDEPLVIKHGGHDDQLSSTVWGLDRLRIRALEKILESGSLSRSDARATRTTLQAKLGVYMTGAIKRERLDEVDRLRTILAKWGLGE